MRNSNQRCSKPEPSDRNRGLAHVILGNYLWNWSTAFKSAVPEDARRATSDLSPHLASELERIDRINVDPDFPYRRHVFEKTLMVGGTAPGVVGDVPVELIVVRFLLDRIFPQVRNEWAEILENIKWDADGVRALIEDYAASLRRGDAGRESYGHFYARRLVEDHRRVIDKMAGVPPVDWSATAA